MSGHSAPAFKLIVFPVSIIWVPPADYAGVIDNTAPEVTSPPADRMYFTLGDGAEQISFGTIFDRDGHDVSVEI